MAVMRRRHDGWLNATQILKVAGVDKGKRTKVLEKEILTGEHEKVQGGYGKYQGTWINYHRGREFCRQYGVEQLLLPLLEYDHDQRRRRRYGPEHRDTYERTGHGCAAKAHVWWGWASSFTVISWEPTLRTCQILPPTRYKHSTGLEWTPLPIWTVDGRWDQDDPPSRSSAKIQCILAAAKQSMQSHDLARQLQQWWSDESRC